MLLTVRYSSNFSSSGQLFMFVLQVNFDSALVQLASELVCAFTLVRVVQRTRQCLDFVCTFHLFHLIFLILYNRLFPTELSWWLFQVFGITVCTVLGEYLCRKAESREIHLSQAAAKYEV